MQTKIAFAIIFHLLLSSCDIFCLQDRNDYGVFENVAATESLFSNETTKLLPSLYSLRDLLKHKHRTLLNKTTSHIDLERLARDLSSVESEESIVSSSPEFPTYERDYKGALKGLMILVDSYDLDMDDFVNGKVTAHNELSGGQFQGRHSLSMADIVNLASQAFEYNWYDSSILYMKKAMSLHKHHPHSIPKEQMDQVSQFQRHIVEYHNQMLRKKQKRWGEGFKLLPYIVDEASLEPAKKQPKFVDKLEFSRSEADLDDLNMVMNEKKDEAGRRICRKELTGEAVMEQKPYLKCHYLHQDNPYLRLGPFKLEKLLFIPVRMIIHDLLSEAEINWIMEYSQPLMSRTREEIDEENLRSSKERGSRITKPVGQTVRTFIKTVKYAEEEKYDHKNVLEPLKDPYTLTVIHPVFRAIQRKIEIVTRLRVRGRFSAGDFQVSTYGLGGLLESHTDTQGYQESLEVPKGQPHLPTTGDTIFTIQSWLTDVEAGGATAFDNPDFEQAVWPRKGSAAIWVDMDRKGHTDIRSSHAGCPILKGAKWILNKWIFYYDQFQEYPCGLYEWEEYQVYDRHY